MKKTMLFSSALVALAMLASCQKEEFIETPATATGVTEFTATIESTKTTIASDGKVNWEQDDEITVTDDENNSAVYVAASSGSSTTFTLKPGQTAVGAGPYKATYGDINNQKYSANGANCPLTAQSSTTNFTFSSPYAVLKITATSETEKTITAVNIINGDAPLSTLNCGSGLPLSSSGTVFYVAVEPGTYNELKITMDVVDTDPLLTSVTKKRSGGLTLNAGDLLPLSLNYTMSDWSAACVAAGTMITMWNGAQKVVEEIEIGDVIRTVDHETGNVSSAPVCFIWKTENVSNAFTLTFEGGTEVKVIEEHGFYDKEERKYAFINARNAKDYIGHHFYDADNNRWLELKGCKLSNESVDAYAIITSKHLNHLSNGILSMCDGSVKVLANIFEYDEQMRFDADKKAADIAAYGLTPLEKILEYKGFLESDYYDYNLQYLNVAIGKGLTSWDYVKALSDYCEANQIY